MSFGISSYLFGEFYLQKPVSIVFEIIGAILFFTAIVNYFRSEKTNRLEEYNFKFLKDIFSNLPDASVIYSLESEQVVFDNQMTSKQFSNSNELVQKVINIFPQTKDFNMDLSNIEVEIEIKSGEKYPYLVSLKHLGTVDRHIILTFKCIQEMKQKDSYIKNQQESLVESSRFTALGEMASGFAHEINNPLTIILGNLSIMKIQLDMDKFNKEKFTKCLDKSTDSINRIVKTIKSLQKLANVKKDKQLHRVEEILDICESHVSLLSEQFKDNFKVDVNVYVDKEQQLNLNLNQISQSLGHVIKNAIEASLQNEDSWIQIDVTEKDDQGIYIDVIDSGPGIDHEMTEKIFNPMYTTKIEEKGAGIGLSLSRSFITHNQGTIAVKPESKHTTLQIYLPYFNDYKNFNAA